MEEKKLTTEELATFCKKKGFVFQAAEIYGGFAGFFDFGPLGVELKNNLKNLYWNKFVNKREDVFGQDGSIITNPKVWKASGHIDNFADLVLTTKDTKTKVRADHFIEDQLKIPADGMSASDINELIKKHDLKLNEEEFEEVKDFNLMFNTQVGADTTKNATTYLRPETAQSIFPNFRSVAEVSRAKLPFGIAQVGKAFRNEIAPRDFVFRCREFEQIEMEYFVNPNTKCEMLTKKHLDTKFQFLDSKNDTENEEKTKEKTFAQLIKEGKVTDYHAYWICEFYNFYVNEIGINPENLRIREHVKTELSHYSKGTYDIDFRFPFGFKELMGIANRGNYDLTQHQEHSKQKLEFFDEENKTKLLPEVIEPALGVERLFAAVLYEAYNDNKDRGNVVLSLNPKLSPYKVAVFPLNNKDGLPEIARSIVEDLFDNDIIAFYDKSGSVGKRYARQDEIGTPYCVTVDYECVEDGEDKGTVTIRDRDSTKQKRVKVEEVSLVIRDLIKGKSSF